MKNEYNDDLILSPELMDRIAKKYYKILDNKNNNHLSPEDFSQLCDFINFAHINITTLKKTCRIKNEYKLNTILHNLSKLKQCFNLPATNINQYEKDATQLIGSSILLLCDCLCLLLKHDNRNGLYEYIYLIIIVIKDISSLLKETF